MEVRIIKDKISIQELGKMAEFTYGDMIKAVVDIEKGIMAVGGEMHSDTQASLITDGSNQKDLWGINIYPGMSKDQLIEFTSLINVRPADNNFDMEIRSPEIKERIRNIVYKLLNMQ